MKDLAAEMLKDTASRQSYGSESRWAYDIVQRVVSYGKCCSHER